MVRQQIVQVAPVGMQMERNEMHAATDAARGHPLDEFIATGAEQVVQPDHVKMPRMRLAFVRARGWKNRLISQLGVVSRGHLSAATLKIPGFLQLLYADRSRDVGHVVFDARSYYLVAPCGFRRSVAVERVAADPVQTHHATALGYPFVPRDYHPALAGRDSLRRVKTEDRGVSFQRSDRPASIGGRQRVRRVFHYFQPMFARDGDDRIHLASQSGEMDGQDRFGPRRDRAFDLLRVNVESARGDVNEDRLRAQMPDNLRRRGESVRSRDDFISGSNAQGFERQVQSRRRRINGQRPGAAAYKSGEVFFKLSGFGACCKPARS